MKKIIFPILMITFVVSTAFAEPFGLSKGMSVKEITNLSKKDFEPKNFTNDDKYFFIPKNEDKNFKTCIAFIDKEQGLYRINALGLATKTSVDGTEIKKLFYSIVEDLSKSYGTPIIIDQVDISYGSNEDKFWLHSLAAGARDFYAKWEKGEKNTFLPKDLEKVVLSVKATLRDATLIIDYYFSNYVEIEKKKKNAL